MAFIQDILTVLLIKYKKTMFKPNSCTLWRRWIKEKEQKWEEFTHNTVKKNLAKILFYFFCLGHPGYNLSTCSFVNSFFKSDIKFEFKIRKTCYLVIFKNLMVRYISFDFIYYMMISRPFPRIYGKKPWNCQL